MTGRNDHHSYAVTWLMRPTVAVAVAASALGALALGLVARRYGLDHPDGVGPGLAADLAWAALYLGGVLFLAAGWLALARSDGLRLRTVVAVAALVHGLALLGAPYLSRDPLAYVAIGRAVAGDGRHPAASLAAALPADDPVVARLNPSVRAGGDVYGPAFDRAAGAIARIAGPELSRALRLHQLLAALALLAAGLLVGAAAGPRAAALVLLSPLAVVEATQNAHNDALLMPSVALFALLWTRRRPRTALVALAGGLLIKASALLLLAMHAGRAVCARLPPAWRRSRALQLAAAAAALAAAAASLALLPRLAFLVGSPADPYDYCTRSVECLPRVLLRFLAHAPTAAWAVGLAFRALGAFWLGFVALRAVAAGDDLAAPLRWLATGLFGYYLYLHGWAQSWYYLSLLPLLPWADPRLAPAMRALCVSAVAYYAVAIPFEHATAPAALLVRDLLGGAVTVAPPTVMLWRVRRAAPTAASPPAPPTGR